MCSHEAVFRYAREKIFKRVCIRRASVMLHRERIGTGEALFSRIGHIGRNRFMLSESLVRD